MTDSLNHQRLQRVADSTGHQLLVDNNRQSQADISEGLAGMQHGDAATGQHPLTGSR